METIYNGWLIKSPHDRPWKLLKPKWRRRYFVLCISQASTTIPGQCPAVLDYYDNEKQLHKRGSIDLSNCDEVKTDAGSMPYEHVFSLYMKHKDHCRKYVFAAESGEDMNRWVQCLCTVLQLNDGPETSNDASVSMESSGSSTVDERYVRVPQMPATPPVLLMSSGIGYTGSQHSSPDRLLPEEYDATSTLTDKDQGEAYIHLDECYSGLSAKTAAQRVNLQPAEGFFSPASASQKSDGKRYPSMKVEELRNNQKRMEYCNISKEDENCDQPDGWHSQPTSSSHNALNHNTVKMHEIPSCVAQSSDQKSRAVCSDGAFMSVINQRPGVGKKMDGSCMKASSSTHFHGSPTPNPKFGSGFSLASRDSDFPSYINLNSVGSLPHVHQYMNAASVPLSSRSPCSSPKSRSVTNGSQAIHGAMNNSPTRKVGIGQFGSPAAASNVKREPTRVGVSTVEMAPALMSRNIQSFKRNITHSDVPLPIKKYGQAEDSSSSDNDASDDDDDSPTFRSYEEQDEPPPVPLPPKKRSLDTTVPPPKDAIQYLDLNLDDSIRAEISPAQSETNYNEIDWVKTKALLETKKDLESERHNSEKLAE